MTWLTSILQQWQVIFNRSQFIAVSQPCSNCLSIDQWEILTSNWLLDPFDMTIKWSLTVASPSGMSKSSKLAARLGINHFSSRLNFFSLQRDRIIATELAFVFLPIIYGLKGHLAQPIRQGEQPDKETRCPQSCDPTAPERTFQEPASYWISAKLGSSLQM